MFNTIILLHGDAVLSKMEMKKFKKGDTVINDWADVTEVKRWKMSEKDEAIAELASKKCTYKKGIELMYIDEWALEYCECDEDGEFVEQSLFISVKDEETREDVNEKDCLDKIVQNYEVQYDDVILYV